MMIVSHSIGIGSDVDGSRCDRITNVRFCNGKFTDRIAIVPLYLRCDRLSFTIAVEFVLRGCK